jgi:(E)-4-hydroxy-3-methylbut-2-enyl-diphosphate synthase
LTGDPKKEVEAANSLLRVIGKKPYAEIISCPTCSRCKYDLEGIVKRVEEISFSCQKNIKIAVMGCVVNGPGEAEDADIGIAGSNSGKAAIFKKGKVIAVLPFEQAFVLLESEIKKLMG